mmetsp:Transcript_40760/g.121592  ORF Transcript_40760/g.121592 Transcript_40760/m.121592 type:complete len:223 (+) Transcript_40760:1970-2638(+)
MRSPPKMRNRLSSKERKKRVEPGSPWRPERPRSWLSMRRDSWRSVPITCSPPSLTTSAFSTSVTALYSASIVWNASRSCSVTASLLAPRSHATIRRSSASSTARERSPHARAAASTAAAIFDAAPGDSSHGKSSGLAAQFRARGFPLRDLSTWDSSSTTETTRGMSISRSLRRAMNSGFPPRMMSVPRPAMLVEMVTQPLRPDCAMISDSRSTFSGFALSVW